MPKPWEMTAEAARREGEALRDRLAEADRADAMFFHSVSARASLAETKGGRRDPSTPLTTARRTRQGSD